MSFFQGSSNVNAYNSNFYQIDGNAHINQIHENANIHGNVTVIRFGDDGFTQHQRNWIRDIISSHTTLPDINYNLNRHFLTQLIINLPRAEAVFNDYQNKKKSGPCFEGTRVELLREMADWATDMEGSRMYILSGLAGIGKSTVAYTIASRAADLNLLGASFFFSRDEADRNNVKKLFTTIAYQLCVYNEAFAKAIGEALQTQRGSAATTKDPQEQLQALIIDPLRSIVQSRTRPILVVVDALDECDQDDQYSVILGLSQLVRDLPPFKVILTTRPGPYFNHFLCSQDSHKLFHMQDIEHKVVDSDIRLYLKYNLSLDQVRKDCHRGQWCANDKEIDCLVHAAGRLFIIASTAVRYILDKCASNPAAQTQKLLHAFAQDRTPFRDLDHFYTIILRNVIPVDCDDDGIVDRYQSVVGAIIFVQRPLPVSTLSHLMDVNEEEIRVVLDHLQSVILLGDDDVPRVYHKSFPDYLTNEARCKDVHLRIDSVIAHTQIASRCFEIADKHLKYNILELGKTARYMSNKGGLREDRITKEQIHEKIPRQLRYACAYWAIHVQVAKIDNTDVMNGLSKFVNKHVLHWIEALSLLGILDLAHRAIRVVLKLLNPTSSDLYQLLSDALRFISKSYEIIKHSALHTYYSALPFSPTYSLLYQHFIKKEEFKTFVIEGGPENWDALVANPNHEQDIDFLKFSNDSALFFSCSEGYVVDKSASDECTQGKLKIWDAATGTPISTIPGQYFAVTNDFSTIASSEGNIITYYNTNGRKTGTMLTTSSEIKRLALSDCGRIAAALADGTVWLWKTKDSGEFIDVFDEFKGSEDRFQLQFSSTGTRLAYCLAEKRFKRSVTKLRDGISGRFIADLVCGTDQKFVFSGDGSRIASWSCDGWGLTVWSSESGALICARRMQTNCLAISENGSLLATANYVTVTLWSKSHDHLAEIKVLPEDKYINSMAFSADNNILAIEVRDNIKLYDVKTHSLISTLPVAGGLSVSVVPAFSPDCTRLAYGGDRHIYLWDNQSIDTASPLSNGAPAVTAIALSRDCSRLACGYEDGRVELWGTIPEMRRIASHQTNNVIQTAFGPNSRLFASVSYDGTIKLWNGGDGSLHGNIQAPSGLTKVVLSKNLLVAEQRSGHGDFTLWSLDTLSLIHTFQELYNELFGYTLRKVSISDESNLVAICFKHHGVESVDLFDVVNRRTIATFKVSDWIEKLTFLPDKPHLMVQLLYDNFLSFNLIDKCITERQPMFECLIQLPNTPLWHGVPIRHSWSSTQRQDCFEALFSRHKSPVPVLWIPLDFEVEKVTEGSSMIALGRRDGRIVLFRLPTSDKDDTGSWNMPHPNSTDTSTTILISNPESAGNALHTINQRQEVPVSQNAATKRTFNPMSELEDAVPTEQGKYVGHGSDAMAKKRKTVIDD